MFPLLSFSLRRIQRYEKHLAAIVLFSARLKFSSTERTRHSDDLPVALSTWVASNPLQGQMLSLFFKVLKELGHDSFIPAAYSDPVWQL